MKKYKYGLKTDAITKRIAERGDNVYKADMIQNVLDMYFDECFKALENGEKVYLGRVGSALGTLAPKVKVPFTCSIPYHSPLPTYDGDIERKPHTNIVFQKSRKIQDKMNENFRKNIEDGVPGLGKQCMCTKQQIGTLIDKGLLEEGEYECTEQ